MNQGDIILILHPYTDYSSVKVRPALVVSSNDYNRRESDAIFIPISSSISRISPEDVLIEETDDSFSMTGLKKPSTIRTGKILTVEQQMAKTLLGTASNNLMTKVCQKLKVLLNIS